MQRLSLGRDRPLPGELPAGVRVVLEAFVADVAATLAGSIEGVILFGSLVSGGFDPGTSDLDLLVAVSADVDDATLASLGRMHRRLVLAHPDWEDRLDVCYASTVALQTFKEHVSPLVVISRGEPLHRTCTDPGWIMNWHVARKVGTALLGPSPRDLIAETTDADFASAVRFYMRWMLAKLAASDAPELHAYAVVAACRALHVCSTGAQASKQAAALWAERRYPEWATLIREAREWRKRESGRRQVAKTPIPRSLGFVSFAVEETSAERKPSGP